MGYLFTHETPPRAGCTTWILWIPGLSPRGQGIGPGALQNPHCSSAAQPICSPPHLPSPWLTSLSLQECVQVANPALCTLLLPWFACPGVHPWGWGLVFIDRLPPQHHSHCPERGTVAIFGNWQRKLCHPWQASLVGSCEHMQRQAGVHPMCQTWQPGMLLFLPFLCDTVACVVHTST